jgi:hypothetical protein
MFDLERGTLMWAIAGGIALTVAAGSLFRSLSLGPVNVVVPIIGMHIVGGSLLGVLLLGEPMTWNKIVDLAAASNTRAFLRPSDPFMVLRAATVCLPLLPAVDDDLTNGAIFKFYES